MAKARKQLSVKTKRGDQRVILFAQAAAQLDYLVRRFKQIFGGPPGRRRRKPVRCSRSSLLAEMIAEAYWRDLRELEERENGKPTTAP